MAIKNTTISRNSPYFGSLVFPKVLTDVITVGASHLTLTAAQLLSGLLPVNCTDAGNLILPTAALLNAALAGVEVGTSFVVRATNYGDSTASVVMGTGITNVTIDSEVSVLTIGTHQSLTFTLVCTGVATPSVVGSVDSWAFYGHGVTTAATA